MDIPSIANDPPGMMTKEEAREATNKIRESLDALTEWEREDLIRFALSLDERGAECLKH